jgi:hypothetical protein
MALPDYEHVSLGATGGTTAAVTNRVALDSNAWSITVPIGFTASEINIQVNNHRAIDPSSANRRLLPRDFALKSIAAAKDSSISADVLDPDFNDKWVVLSNLTSSAYEGTGRFRWMRLAAADADEWLQQTFEAYVSRHHDSK